MKKSNTALIAKVAICVSGSFLLFTAIIFPIVATLLEYQFEEFEMLWIWLWVITVISSVIMVAILAEGNLISEGSVERLPSPFVSYKLLLDNLDQKMIEAGYTQVCSSKQFSDIELTLYAKGIKIWELDCIAVVRTSQINGDLLEQSNVAISELLKSYLGKTHISETINMISVFCVDRITPALKKLVNAPAQQGFKNGRLPTAVSFGSNTIYLPKRGDGFAVGRYFRLKKTFLKLLEL